MALNFYFWTLKGARTMLSSLFSHCAGERRFELPPGETQPTQARQGAASLGAPAQDRPVFPSQSPHSSPGSVSSLVPIEEDFSHLERPQPQATNLWPSTPGPKTPPQAERRQDTRSLAEGPRLEAVHAAESQGPVAPAMRKAPAAQEMQDDAQRPASASQPAKDCCKSCVECCGAVCRILCCR